MDIPNAPRQLMSEANRKIEDGLRSANRCFMLLVDIGIQVKSIEVEGTRPIIWIERNPKLMGTKDPDEAGVRCCVAWGCLIKWKGSDKDDDATDPEGSRGPGRLES